MGGEEGGWTGREEGGQGGRRVDREEGGWTGRVEGTVEIGYNDGLCGTTLSASHCAACIVQLSTTVHVVTVRDL